MNSFKSGMHLIDLTRITNQHCVRKREGGRKDEVSNSIIGDSITEKSFRFGGWGAALLILTLASFFGANDAALLGRTSEWQCVPVEEYKENLRRIVHQIKECSHKVLVVLITPPIDEDGRFEYARSLHGKKAMTLPERTNEVTGVYAKQCIEVAKELGAPSINLWSKMQETEGWQKKFLNDGLHLTPDINAIVHQEVVRVFSEAGALCPRNAI